MFSNDFSGCEILIRNGKFQNPKIQDAGTNMVDMKFRNFQIWSVILGLPSRIFRNWKFQHYIQIQRPKNHLEINIQKC